MQNNQNDKNSQSIKKRILTGDRPTGQLHIGHLIGSLQNRVKLQYEYDQYLMIANVQALTDNFDNPKKVRDNIAEVLCDYYAVGIDFNISTVFIQSEIPQIHEIFIYLANFSTIQQLSHNPTLKTEIGQKKFEASTPLGFYIYPIHQAGDILCVNADLVPVGIDQAPMVEDCRELARKFNATYKTNVLHLPQALFGTQKNLPGVDGNLKMGKSLGNAIYLADSEETLRKKVFSIKTDTNRIRATDPGIVEGNTVFTYHDIFNTNKQEVEDLKERYKKGFVSDVEVKEKLFNAMNEILTPIREKRIEAESIKDDLIAHALKGSAKVRLIATSVLEEMKQAMQISFTKDIEKIKEKSNLKDSIIAGEIIKIEKHSNADNLVICTLNVGNENILIVTGAPNVQVGQLVPIALPGSTVPGLKNADGTELIMKERNFRGVNSYGMMLAQDELGIGNDHSGIYLLDKEKYKVGDKI